MFRILIFCSADRALAPFHRIAVRAITIGLLGQLLACCSLLPPDNAQDQQNQTQPKAPLSKKIEQDDVPSKPFSHDTLLNLLEGELAVYSRDINTAAENYRQEAQITRDPAVIERAARLARFKRDANSALELAELWYEVEPENQKAAENLADMYARTDQPLASLTILEEQLSKNQTANFGVLRNSKYSSEDGELEKVLQRLSTIAKNQQSKNFSLIFTRTLLLQKNGQNEAALEQIKHLKNYETDPVQLTLIEAQLLSELNRHEDAAKSLGKALKKYPDENRLQLTYARTLTKTDLPKAEFEFAKLLQQSPQDNQLLMSHAMVAAENKNYTAAKNSLEQLIAAKQKTNFAHYYLGLVAEQQNNVDVALTHFEQVRPGEHFLPATRRILAILVDKGQVNQARSYLQLLRQKIPLQAPNFWVLEANLLRNKKQTELAHQILSEAIEQFPQQGKLRIERSYLSEQLNLIDLVEQDLSFVLEREPNNAMALNALGYILADRTERYAEAYELIQKAYTILPENAAIQDSMGWVLFKLGDNDAALKYLKLAFAQSVDQEIAAHLIEIYWLQGNKSEARKVYKKLRKETQEHPKVDEVVKRLDIVF